LLWPGRQPDSGMRPGCRRSCHRNRG